MTIILYSEKKQYDGLLFCDQKSTEDVKQRLSDSNSQWTGLVALI